LILGSCLHRSQKDCNTYTLPLSLHTGTILIPGIAFVLQWYTLSAISIIKNISMIKPREGIAAKQILRTKNDTNQAATLHQQSTTRMENSNITNRPQPYQMPTGEHNT